MRTKHSDWHMITLSIYQNANNAFLRVGFYAVAHVELIPRSGHVAGFSR